MANRTHAARLEAQREIESRPENFTTRYLRRLISERPYILAALYNHGGSIITAGVSLDLSGTIEYSSQIGNDYHLDLLEAEQVVVHDLNAQQRSALLAWALGVDDRVAAEQLHIKPGALRKRRQRGVETLQKRLDDGEQSGRFSNGYVAGGSQETEQKFETSGDSGRKALGPRAEEGDSVVGDSSEDQRKT